MTPAPNGRVATVPDLPDYPEPPLAARMAALQAAATFAAGKCLGGSTDIRTADVLKVADAFTRWLEQR
jgi:hypothetical protein